jgi:predicted transcriptional regulator
MQTGAAGTSLNQPDTTKRCEPRTNRPCLSRRFGVACIAIAMQLERNMSAGRSRTLPPLRVSEKMRADAESVLTPGETLSAFVMDAVSRSIDFRRSQQDFVARGLASADRARESGRYVSASKVLAGLRRRLVRARRAHA